MKRILIIKLGALGDVVRTTPLLRVLGGRVTWVTSDGAVPLLTHNPYVGRLVCIKKAHTSLFNENFDLVLNLEEEAAAAALASSIKTRNLIGAYLEDGRVAYTASASEWFDMSLISKFGKAKADELKTNNRRTYQDFIFSMVGRRFQGEEYVLSLPLMKHPIRALVGMEERAGDIWAMKRWSGYEQLAFRLAEAGFKVKFFRQYERLGDYIGAINECEYIVCGDTLAMHAGLALQKKVVAIFICTSPYEIYDYQRMNKIVSPLWQRYFYRRDFVPEAVETVSVESVFEGVVALSKSKSGQSPG
jgi:heptosyltransferase-2